jgi:hypothetical protein
MRPRHLLSCSIPIHYLLSSYHFKRQNASLNKPCMNKIRVDSRTWLWKPLFIPSFPLNIISFWKQRPQKRETNFDVNSSDAVPPFRSASPLKLVNEKKKNTMTSPVHTRSKEERSHVSLPIQVLSRYSRHSTAVHRLSIKRSQTAVHWIRFATPDENNIFFLFGLWGYWHCGHSWPIVPASGDSEDDCGEADGM